MCKICNTSANQLRRKKISLDPILFFCKRNLLKKIHCHITLNYKSIVKTRNIYKKTKI